MSREEDRYRVGDVVRVDDEIYLIVSVDSSPYDDLLPGGTAQARRLSTLSPATFCRRDYQEISP